MKKIVIKSGKSNQSTAEQVEFKAEATGYTVKQPPSKGVKPHVK